MNEERKKELGDITLLAIDDELDQLKLYRLTLLRGSDTIYTSTTCKEGRDMFLQDPSKYDVVVTDLNHVPVSGVDVAEAVIQSSPHTPCYIVTGGASGDLEQRAKDLASQSNPTQGNIVRYIEKPFRLKELHQQLIEDLTYLKDNGFIK